MVAEEVEGKLKYGSHFRFAIGKKELEVNQAKIFHKLQLNSGRGLVFIKLKIKKKKFFYL